jgi:hypothetical protein
MEEVVNGQGHHLLEPILKLGIYKAGRLIVCGLPSVVADICWMVDAPTNGRWGDAEEAFYMRCFWGIDFQ